MHTDISVYARSPNLLCNASLKFFKALCWLALKKRTGYTEERRQSQEREIKKTDAGQNPLAQPNLNAVVLCSDLQKHSISINEQNKVPLFF